MKTEDRSKDYRSGGGFRRADGPERSGGAHASRSGSGFSAPRLVVQKHAAGTLHYDFRLEIGGVLASWAVPKGPSTDPSAKRLAIRTEDHPLDFLDFEGVIPEDEYGGGTVLVWDTGPYRNLKEDEGVSTEDALEDGHLTVWLEGEKLEGGYALTRTETGGDPSNWLLVKMDDAGADARRNPVSTEPESVLSGRTIERIAEEAPGDGEEAS